MPLECPFSSDMPCLMRKVATGCAPGKARERSYKYRSDTVPQKRPVKYWLQLQHLPHPYGSRGSGADRAPHSDRRKIQGKTTEPYCCRWPAEVRKTGYKKYRQRLRCRSTCCRYTHRQNILRCIHKEKQRLHGAQTDHGYKDCDKNREQDTVCHAGADGFFILCSITL